MSTDSLLGVTFQKIQEKTTLMFFHLCIIVDKKQFYLFGFFFKFFYNDFLVFFLWYLFLLFKCVHNIVLRDNSPTYKMRAVIFKVAHFQKFVGREKPTTIFIPSMDSFNYFYNFYNYYDFYIFNKLIWRQILRLPYSIQKYITVQD